MRDWIEKIGEGLLVSMLGTLTVGAVGLMGLLGYAIYNDATKKHAVEQAAQLPAASGNGEIDSKLQACQQNYAGLESKLSEKDKQIAGLTQKVSELDQFRIKYEAVLAGKSPLIAVNAAAIDDNGYLLMTLEEYLMQEEKLSGKFVRIQGAPVAAFLREDFLGTIIEKDGRKLHCNVFNGSNDAQKYGVRDIDATMAYNELQLIIAQNKKQNPPVEIIIYGEGNRERGIWIHKIKISDQLAFNVGYMEKK